MTSRASSWCSRVTPAETETVPTVALRIADLVELVEHRGPMLRRDADAGVANVDTQHAAAPPAADQHPTRLGVAQRIRDQIVQDARENRRIAPHEGAGGDDAQADALLGRGRPEARLERIEEIKAIRKQRKGLALVANRVRANTRAADRLEDFLREIGHEAAGRIADRAIYGELAVQGLSLFDVNTRPAIETAVHWLPLLGFIEQTLRGRR